MYEHLTDLLLQQHPRFISVGDKSWYWGVLNADLTRLDSAGYVIVKKPENGLPVVPEGQMTVDECIAEVSRLAEPPMESKCSGRHLRCSPYVTCEECISELGLDMPVLLPRGWDTDCDPED